MRLTTQPSYENNPIWSPDGKQIAFSSDRHGNFDVFVMPSTGGAAVRLTTNSAKEQPMAFSPDGAWVYFQAGIQDPAQSALFPSGALREVYKVPAAGGRTQQVLATPAEDICFTADGSKMLCASITPRQSHATCGFTTQPLASTPTSLIAAARTAIRCWLPMARRCIS